MTPDLIAMNLMQLDALHEQTIVGKVTKPRWLIILVTAPLW